MLGRPRYGQGRIGCILWLLAVAAFLTVVWKMVPVKIATAELEDYMVEQAKFAGRASAETLKKRVLARAKELDIPLTTKTLKVTKTANRVRMQARYTIPIEFPFYTYYWEFEHDVDRPVFII